MNDLETKFRGHETFYIRKGWLYKGLKNIAQNPKVFTDKNVNTSDTFGLGVSMVKALRYWLQAVGLTKESKIGNSTVQELTEIGKIIFNNDRYIEEIGTLCLLQYNLATNRSLATSWYYFFNQFTMNEFTKEDFVDTFATHLKFMQVNAARTSIEDDYTCILNTYLKKNLTDPEDNMECPFSELGLIEDIGKKTYKKVAPKNCLIPLQILLAIIVKEHPREYEIRISDLLKEERNIGKIFNLDFITLTEYLDKMQVEGLVQVVRTAGLDVIKLKDGKTWQEYIADYYEGIKN